MPGSRIGPGAADARGLEEDEEGVPVSLLPDLAELAEIEAFVLLGIDLDDHQPGCRVVVRRSADGLRSTSGRAAIWRMASTQRPLYWGGAT